jgi:hypothetical protein
VFLDLIGRNAEIACPSPLTFGNSGTAFEERTRYCDSSPSRSSRRRVGVAEGEGEERRSSSWSPARCTWCSSTPEVRSNAGREVAEEGWEGGIEGGQEPEKTAAQRYVDRGRMAEARRADR